MLINLLSKDLDLLSIYTDLYIYKRCALLYYPTQI